MEVPRKIPKMSEAFRRADTLDSHTRKHTPKAEGVRREKRCPYWWEHLCKPSLTLRDEAVPCTGYNHETCNVYLMIKNGKLEWEDEQEIPK